VRAAHLARAHGRRPRPVVAVRARGRGRGWSAPPPARHAGRAGRGVERAARRPGSPAARRVVAFADERSASPGESRSRVALRNAGLPRPVLQREVHGRSGLWLACTDFGRPELRRVGEFGGKAKYGRLLKPGQAPSGSGARSVPRDAARSTCGDLAARRRARRCTTSCEDEPATTTPPGGRGHQGAPGRRHAAGINPFGSSTYLRAAPWSNSW
jgi:hypothetical protein